MKQHVFVFIIISVSISKIQGNFLLKFNCDAMNIPKYFLKFSLFFSKKKKLVSIHFSGVFEYMNMTCKLYSIYTFSLILCLFYCSLLLVLNSINFYALQAGSQGSC